MSSSGTRRVTRHGAETDEEVSRGRRPEEGQTPPGHGGFSWGRVDSGTRAGAEGDPGHESSAHPRQILG